MLFDVRKQVPAKRQAFGTDLELSQITRRFKALKLQEPTGCCGTLPQDPGESGLYMTAPKNISVKAAGRSGKRRVVIGY